MKLTLLCLVFVLFLPFSSASIEIISELKDEYNLGDDIEFSIKIVPDKTVNALIKSTLRCTEREIPYYIAPVNLEAGVENVIEVPGIKAVTEGLCNIRINVESFEGGNLDGITSEEFVISDRLELSVTVDKTDVLPGDEIKIEGSASRKGEEIEDGSIVIMLDNKKGQVELDGKEFSYELKLDDDISSGKHTIIVEVGDSYGNYNEGGVEINVKAIPAVLDLIVNGNEFKPNEELKLKVELLDQANDVINDNVDVKLFREKGLFRDEIILFEDMIESDKEFSFTFNYSTAPLEYKLIGSFGDLSKEDRITILPYPRIDMKVIGDIVIVKNVGNVKFNNETTIMVEREDKTYIINKRIKLDVDEETTIDLSKEVPSGNYTITLPGETVIEERVVEKTVERVIEKEVPKYIEKEVKGKEEVIEEEEVREESANVIEDVEIEDDRPFYKKGLSWITGGVVAGAGLLFNRPKLASFIMVIVILSLIGYFNRGRIEKVIEKIKERRERF